MPSIFRSDSQQHAALRAEPDERISNGFAGTGIALTESFVPANARLAPAAAVTRTEFPSGNEIFYHFLRRVKRLCLASTSARATSAT